MHRNIYYIFLILLLSATGCLFGYSVYLFFTKSGAVDFIYPIYGAMWYYLVITLVGVGYAIMASRKGLKKTAKVSFISILSVPIGFAINLLAIAAIIVFMFFRVLIFGVFV